MTPEQTLTAAAQKVREAANLYGDPGPWVVNQANGFLRVGPLRTETRGNWRSHPGADLPEERQDTADYIALMHPGVGSALAPLLEAAADDMAQCERINSRDPHNDGRTRVLPHPIAAAALAVARQILGDQP